MFPCFRESASERAQHLHPDFFSRIESKHIALPPEEITRAGEVVYNVYVAVSLKGGLCIARGEISDDLAAVSRLRQEKSPYLARVPAVTAV